MEAPTILAMLIERHGIQKKWLAARCGIHYNHFVSVTTGDRKLTDDVASKAADAMRLDLIERQALLASAGRDLREKEPVPRPRRKPRPQVEEEPIVI